MLAKYSDVVYVRFKVVSIFKAYINNIFGWLLLPFKLLWKIFFCFLLGMFLYSNAETIYTSDSLVTFGPNNFQFLVPDNDWSVPFLAVVHSNYGMFKQLQWNKNPNFKRKMGICFVDGFQVESFIKNNQWDDITSTTVYTSRKWTSPINGSFLITLYQTKIISFFDGITTKTTRVQDFNTTPTKYAISATSDTLAEIQWIQKGFKPCLVDESTSLTLHEVNK